MYRTWLCLDYIRTPIPYQGYEKCMGLSTESEQIHQIVNVLKLHPAQNL